MEKNILLFTNPRPFLSFFFVLELVYAFEEPLTQIINISGRDDDTNTHFGTLDGKRRVRLKRLDALGHLKTTRKCHVCISIITYNIEMGNGHGTNFLVLTNLTFRIFVCAHRVSCFCHRFLDDADRVRGLRSWIYALLGD